jgi:hypothetical protein
MYYLSEKWIRFPTSTEFIDPCLTGIWPPKEEKNKLKKSPVLKSWRARDFSWNLEGGSCIP